MERPRKGIIKVVNKTTGVMENIVLEDRTTKNACWNLGIILFFGIIAFLLWYVLLKVFKKHIGDFFLK